MKSFVPLFLIFFTTVSSFSQNQHQEVGDTCPDTTTYFSTEYPARLAIDQEELRLIIQENLKVYPEDEEVLAKYIFRFTIDCKGKGTHSLLFDSNGPKGISMRIQKILDQWCTWEPAIHHEKPVSTFYYLTVIFNKGKIDVVKQRSK